ncbi:hypothetical protein [Corynebacterium sp.]|uniref:hypothetical protein n=1 Tax=Corynebacterium sp. TaxID=1720 RepID=UPI0026DAD22C|nr:hypothetical protein [Corynebacterium sp.]MDO5032085.1 hypothetical protein [Corynebacterium sp.]
MMLPPEPVLSAFHAETTTRGASGEAMGPAWDNGIKVGDTVYAHANAWTAWSARVREKLAVPGARVARPVLASDGRYTAAGWKATQFIPGQVRGRIDEAVQLALRLDTAMSSAPLPAGGQRSDVFARAENAAWEEDGEAYDMRALAGRPLVTAHMDLLGTTLFSGANPPAIVDLVPSCVPRPAGWTAALVMVDGLIAGAVDDGICARFAHVPGIDQLLLRAAAYRRYVNNLHPQSQSTTRSNIERVEEMMVSRASETLSA